MKMRSCENLGGWGRVVGEIGRRSDDVQRKKKKVWVGVPTG